MNKPFYALIFAFLMIGSFADQCSAPFAGPGCFDFFSIAESAIDASTGLINEANGDDATDDSTAAGQFGTVMKELVGPAISLFTGLASNSSYAAAAFVDTGFCIGEWSGQEIRDGDDTFEQHGCSNIPVKETEDFMLVSFGISTALLTAVCPTTYPPAHDPAIASMCVAYGDCAGGPTVAIALSGPLLACTLGAMGAPTAGLAAAVGKAVEAGLQQVALGISVDNDLTQDYTIWDGSDIITVTVEGNYFDYIEISFEGLQKSLKLPEVIQITGSMTRLVRIPTGFISDPTDIDELTNFAFGAYINAEVQLKLSEFTNGALPDSPTIELASATGLITAIQDPDYPAGGLYIMLAANDVFTRVVQGFFDFVFDTFDGIFDAFLPDAISVDQLKDLLVPSQTQDTEFALTINEELIGFMIKAPLSGTLASVIGNTISLSCKVKFSNGNPSCKLILNEPKYFSIIKEGALFVAYETADFFEDTGSVIAAVAEDAWDEAGKWTENAVQTTAEGIVNGAYAASNAIQTFAESKQFMCGVDVVTSAAKCGWDTVEDAAICGVQSITNGVICGTTTVTSAAQCGADFVANLAVCGATSVTDGAICGWNTITSSTLCGVDYVKTGWTCVSKCAPFFKGSCRRKYCAEPKSCKTAATCNVTNKCNVPRTCSIDNTCNIPKSCDIEATCNVPKSCL